MNTSNTLDIDAHGFEKAGGYICFFPKIIRCQGLWFRNKISFFEYFPSRDLIVYHPPPVIDIFRTASSILLLKSTFVCFCCFWEILYRAEKRLFADLNKLVPTINLKDSVWSLGQIYFFKLLALLTCKLGRLIFHVYFCVSLFY